MRQAQRVRQAAALAAAPAFVPAAAAAPAPAAAPAAAGPANQLDFLLPSEAAVGQGRFSLLDGVVGCHHMKLAEKQTRGPLTNAANFEQARQQAIAACTTNAPDCLVRKFLQPSDESRRKAIGKFLF